MDFLSVYLYWILGGNVTSIKDFPDDASSNLFLADQETAESKQEQFLKFWKTFTSPIDYRHPVQTDRTHDLRKPIELAHDFDLRRPSLPDESHDLRWPVVEEDSHDLRNPAHDYDPVEPLDPAVGEHLVDIKPDEDSFWRHDGITVDVILSKEQALNKCLEEFSAGKIVNYDHGKMQEDSMKVCGQSRRKTLPRLVGGKNSEYLQWPWMVSVQQRYRGEYRHKCGAALLSSLWVVTAAHCVEWSPMRNLVLRLGSHDLNKDEEIHPFVDRSIDKKVIHAEFDPITFENDIALLRMATPVEFQPNILPVCLPEGDADREGKMAVVLGWGRVTERGVLSGILKEVYLPVLSNQKCEEMYETAGANEKILETFLCAGTAEGGADACDGDSGGPMSILNKDGRWSLIGIVSWGKVCAAPNQPGVYTRITKFLKWIEGNIACITD